MTSGIFVGVFFYVILGDIKAALLVGTFVVVISS